MCGLVTTFIWWIITLHKLLYNDIRYHINYFKYANNITAQLFRYSLFNIKPDAISIVRSESFERYAPDLYWKITWPPFIPTSALKIVPLAVRVYNVGFIKCIDITVFCFILNQSIVNQRKKITIFLLVYMYYSKL